MTSQLEHCVVTRIQGGLGNQLFAYAAGYALARRLGVPLQVDIRGYAQGSGRALLLREFEMPIVEASKQMTSELTPTWGPWWKNKALIWGNRLTPVSQRKWLQEKTLDFDERLFRVRPPVYLDGLWQSEKYFVNCADEIRRMFRFRSVPSPRASSLGLELAEAPTIAVHLRRGDYADNPDAARFHGCSSLGYYNHAVQWMRERLPNATFCVFSDDQPWARAHLRIEGSVRWIDSMPAHSTLEDFYLMGCCTHFIIANSSFSWWSAWLRPGSGKLVVAPRQWFLAFDVNIADRFPPEWHLVDA